MLGLPASEAAPGSQRLERLRRRPPFVRSAHWRPSPAPRLPCSVTRGSTTLSHQDFCRSSSGVVPPAMRHYGRPPPLRSSGLQRSACRKDLLSALGPCKGPLSASRSLVEGVELRRVGGCVSTVDRSGFAPFPSPCDVLGGVDRDWTPERPAPTWASGPHLRRPFGEGKPGALTTYVKRHV